MEQNPKPLPLKDLVNFLFEHIQHPDGRPYLSQEVADQVQISHATINQLRTGRIKNPTLPTLKDLCQFFDVPLSFFECATYEDCYALLAQKRAPQGSQASEIAFRASQLSPQAQKQVLTVLHWVEIVEQARKAGHEMPEMPDLSDPE
jgi:transcriptional regulator with XRE-family HTH domain